MDHQPAESAVARTRAQLDALADQHGFALLENRVFPDFNYGEQHLVVTPTRVYVVSVRFDTGLVVITKSGEYPNETSALLVNGVNRRDLLDDARALVGDVRMVVDTPGVPFMPVIGMLVLPQSDLQFSLRPTVLQTVQVHGSKLAGAFRHEYAETPANETVVGLLEEAFPARD